MSPPVKLSDKMYPTLHLEWPKDYELPESGTLTVTYKKVREEKTKRDGKTRFTVDLEVRSIEEVEEGENSDEKSKEESGSDALDRIKSEKQAEYNEEG